MNLLLLCATRLEIEPTLTIFEKEGKSSQTGTISWNGHSLLICISGVGTFQTTYTLTKHLGIQRPDGVIQVGIAGAYDRDLSPGCVYQVVTEAFGDLGAEDHEGKFLSLSDIGLGEIHGLPNAGEQMENPWKLAKKDLPMVRGLTLNTVTGTAQTAQRISHRYPWAQIETMEGAPFFGICLRENIPFLCLRSVSNYVEPRNRANWKMVEAIQELNTKLQDLLKTNLFIS